MARFRRYTRYRRRWYGRYYRRRRYYRRSYGRRFANGSSKSRVRIKVPVQFNVSLNVPANSNTSNVLTICPFFDNGTATAGTLSEAAVRGGLTNSQLFINYGNLYDSFKVDGMKVGVAITSHVGAGAGAFPSLAIYTAWDRKFERSDFTLANQYPTVANLKTSSSFQPSTAVNNSITKLKRSCYASDIFEKASFIDCHAATLATQMIAGVANQSLTAFTSSDAGSIAYPAFCPCFMMGVDTGSSIDSANARPVNLVVEVMYYVTFRNPKFGGASASSKGDDIAIPRSIAMDDEDADLDHEDDDDLLELAAEAVAAAPKRATHSKVVSATDDIGPLAAGKKRHSKNQS